MDTLNCTWTSVLIGEEMGDESYLTPEFGIRRRRSGSATAAGEALFLVVPKSVNVHHSLVLKHLLDQTMLNTNAA